MSAGPSRSRVTRIELTADQLLGSSLTPARPHKPSKHAPKTITVEQLLGTSLTIAPAAARGSSSSSAGPSSSPSRSAVRPSPPRPRPQARSASPRRTPAVPNRNRVTADEVLRTGLSVRTLQAAKQRARSGQTLVLTAEQLLGSSASSSSRAGASGSSGSSGLRVLTAEELAGPGIGSRSSRRTHTDASPTSPSAGTSSRSGAGSSRVARPSTAAATLGPGGSSSIGRGRDGRPRQLRRSSSLGSIHTLPIYTKEPGESEVVIDRGTDDLEDEIPTTVMTPVDEDGLSLARSLPNHLPSQPANLDIVQHLSPPASPTTNSLAINAASSPVMSPVHLNSIPSTPPPAAARTPFPSGPPAPYPDEVPSYEVAMSMSTPDLHALPLNIPLPSSPALSALGSPRALSPGPSTASPPPTPASPPSRPSSIHPPSSPTEAESHRSRFGFVTSLFHSHGRTRNRGSSVSGLPGPAATDRGFSPSPSIPALRPLFHRSSQSASGSMLDLLSLSWSDSHMVRSRSDRGGAS